MSGLEAGDGYVISERSTELSTDGSDVRIEWGTPGDTFNQNQLVFRVQARVNLDVFKAHGVVQMNLSDD